jgi:methylated-DNA-[protein]-cysteine S-methyltransferase
MTGSYYALFDTRVGRCAVAWGEAGIRLLQLPEGGDAATVARVRARCPAARESVPPEAVRAAIDSIAALLRGEPSDLSHIDLDMTAVPPFHERVYRVARAIPAGATLTYGEVARRLGAPGAARAVGQALGKNPFAIIVPCHRVLAAGGKMGGFSANGGVRTKQRLLALETASSEPREPCVG